MRHILQKLQAVLFRETPDSEPYDAYLGSHDTPQSPANDHTAEDTAPLSIHSDQFSDGCLSQHQIGMLFKAARLEMNLSIQDIALATRIRLAYLEAIESGRFHDLPSTIYATGFIRLYARHVRLDGDEILRRMSLDRTETILNKSMHHVRHHAHPSRMILYTSLCLTLLCMGGAFYMYDFMQTATAISKSYDVDESIDPDTPLEQDLSHEVETSASTVALESVETVSHDSNHAESSSPHISASSSDVASSPVADTAAPAQAWNLSLHAREDCWVSIVQDEKKILSAVLKKGQDFHAPINETTVITAGNAPVLDITVNEKKLPPLSDHDRVVRSVSIVEFARQHA